MIIALWHGGSSYSSPYSEDAERFDSIEEAKEAMRSRRNHGYSWKQDFRFIFREEESTLTPAVNEESYMDLYFFPNSQPLSSIREIIDYRSGDRRLEFGPRGGIRQERF